MNFTMNEIFDMTIDQMFIYCEASSKHFKEKFKENVIATSWGTAGVPDEMRHLFD